jgi:hypothetical protein
MGNDRRTILALVAAGRLSAAEAERLVRAWNEPARWFLVVLGCLLLLHPHLPVLQLEPPAATAHWLHEVVRHALDAGYKTAMLLVGGKEGSV